MTKEKTCIICPRGCHLVIDLDNYHVTGNSCPRGEKYIKEEIICPKRTLTTSVRARNKKDTLISVKSSLPIPKDKIMEVMNEINKASITLPCHIGDIVIENVLNLNVDIIVTKEVNL